MGFDEDLAKVNGRLKTGKIGLTVERRGDRLWFRGTLPPKPDSDRARPYQQRFAANLPANVAGLQQAERKAKLVGAQLALGEFEWGDWQESLVRGDSCAEWIERYERHYWQGRRRSPSTENSWKKIIEILRRLPLDAELSHEVLVRCAIAYPADSRVRQRACTVLSNLARFAGIDPKGIVALSGHYSPDSVEPRELPSDDAIAEWRKRIQHPGWKWLYGMQAAYGLRNHELFHVNLDEFPTIWIEPGTKTGRRFVYPVYPEWANEWDLEARALPDLAGLQGDRAEWNNTALGAKVAKYFKKSGVPWTPYYLRHAYARRCFECAIAPDLAAKLMGHSLAVHLRIYRAWIEEAAYKKAYEAAMAKRG